MALIFRSRVALILTVLVVLQGFHMVEHGVGPWAWVLVVWAAAHSLEHLYLLVRFLQVRGEMAAFGVSGLNPEGLAGVLGRDGWLARSSLTQGSFIGRLPGLTTAVRLDIHFWWNAGEVALLLRAAQPFWREQRSRLTAKSNGCGVETSAKNHLYRCG